MIFLNGTKASQILYETCLKQKKTIPPFYLLTAYEDEYLRSSSMSTVKLVISKPLSKEIANKLFFDN
jgi:hypothetical protein